MQRVPRVLFLAAAVLVQTARATEIRLQLGDLIAFGDGCGLGEDQVGINPRNGKVANPNQFAGSGGTGPAFKAADGTGGKVNLPLVDGVMNIDGVSPIDSQGGAFAFPPTQNATTWDAIRKDVALVESNNSPVPMQLGDQPGVDRDGIGLHTNCGVTFDLLAIRNHFGASTLRVEGVAGLNFESCTGGDVEIWVVVDGVQKYRKEFLIGGAHEAFSIELSDQDRFLTIASTDYDQSDGCDHGVVADAFLVVDGAFADCNGNGIEDACELFSGAAEDCDLDQTPDDCQWSFLAYGEGCPGAGGKIPALALSGCAAPGGTLFFSIQGGLGNALALIVAGTGDQSSPLIGPGGCWLHVSGLLPFAIPVPLGAAGNAVAFASLPAGAPIQGTFALQAFVLDPFAAQGFANTNAVLADLK